MQKENKWLGRISKANLLLGIISSVLLLLYFLAPSIIGGMAPAGSAPSASSSGKQMAISNGLSQLQHLVGSVLSSLLFLVLIPLGLLTLAGMVLSIIEIGNAANSTGWKALWIIILIVLGWIGIVLYWFVGRKSLT